MRPKTWTSPEQALALLQEAARSPKTILAFCWEKDLRPQTFFRWKRKYRHLLSAAILGLATGSWPAQAQEVPPALPGITRRLPTTMSEPGFLVLAPDRGFLGNEEIREAFEAFARHRNAALAVVTDARTKGTLEDALDRLARAGARRVVVLPAFLSASDPRLKLAKGLLAEHSGERLAWARAFGESTFAVEALADRLRLLPEPQGRRVVIVGEAPPSSGSRAAHQADLGRIAAWAAEGLGFESVKVVVEAQEALPQALEAALQGGERPVLVPYHLGKKLDSMMGFEPLVRASAPHGVEVVPEDPAEHPALALWMGREANRSVPPKPEETGVVLLAHGSDHHWNETMLGAVASLKDRYLLEPALCMADPPVVARAVKRLEVRGAKAIVIVRVFGLQSSFQRDVERMIGQDVESGTMPALAVDHGHHHSPQANRAESAQPRGHSPSHGQASHGPMVPAPRLRSSAAIVTLGGLEDHPLFAQVLLERAKSMSKDPGKETVLLVAHGSGDDHSDAHWNHLLEALANRMRNSGGEAFRAIRTGTWREDWPEQREPARARIQGFVREASRGGGRALVVPARTLGQGFERQFLEGLNFELGEGFAPHPLFAQWFEEQVRAGIQRLGAGNAKTLSQGGVMGQP